MSKYWFIPKNYGWGFCPITWQGWLSSFFLLASMATSAYINNFFTPNPSPQDITRFFLDFFIIILISILYFVPKTKGKLKWRWGK